MVWIGSVHCEKFRLDFVARTFALIAPVLLVLHQVLCSSETVQNAPKRKETNQNMSLGSNGADRERRFPEILTRLCGTNSCINCTRFAHLHRVSCSSEMVPNAPKRKETHQKNEFRVQWCGSGAFIAKNSSTTSCINIYINCTCLALLHQVSCRKKRTKTRVYILMVWIGSVRCENF